MSEIYEFRVWAEGSAVDADGNPLDADGNPLEPATDQAPDEPASPPAAEAC